MQAKEFMLQVQKAENELLIISAKRRHYIDLIQSIGAKMSNAVVQGSNGDSKTETAAIGLYEMEKMLAEKEKEYLELIKKAEEAMGKIKQAKFREILTYKYICRWSWKSIRDQLDYKDEKSVYRCHGYALKELQKVL